MGRLLAIPEQHKNPRRITYRDLFADILLDNRSQTPSWVYIVQRQGEAEILSMGTCAALADCIRDAKEAMRELANARKHASSE